MSTAIAKSEPKPIDNFKNYLKKFEGNIIAVLPKHLKAERVMKIATAAVSRNPSLLECTFVSIVQGIMQASELGLELSGSLGHAYLVPFRNNKTGKMEAQFITGYKGLALLARHSGEISGIEARSVYENDFFQYEHGLEQRLTHKPAEGERGNYKGAYCIVRYKDGHNEFEYLPKSEIDKHKSRSKASAFGPWVTDYEPMANKTAVKVALRLAPLTPEMPMTRALELENRAEQGEGVEDLGFAVLEDEEENVSQTDKLKAGLKLEKDEAVNTTTGEITRSTAELSKEQMTDIKFITKALEALSVNAANNEKDFNGADVLRQITDNAAIGTVTELSKHPDLIGKVSTALSGTLSELRLTVK